MSTPPIHRITLPNGAPVYCLNEAEALWLYRDLFEERSYFAFGISIRPGATVLDVGANIGLFAMLAAREAPDVHVVSLEPLPPLYAALEKNFELHHIRGQPLCCAAGRRAERGAFAFYSKNTALSGRYTDLEEERKLISQILANRQPQFTRRQIEFLAMRGLDRRSYECTVYPLSQVLRDRDIQHVDLLKIDVEKAEWDVLQGIEDVHWQCIDQVVVEVHDIDDRLAQIRRTLETNGFLVECRQGPALQDTGLYDIFARRDRT